MQTKLSPQLEDRLLALLSPAGARVPVDQLSVSLNTMDIASGNWHDHVCVWAVRRGLDPSCSSPYEFGRVVRAFLTQVFKVDFPEVH